MYSPTRRALFWLQTPSAAHSIVDLCRGGRFELALSNQGESQQEYQTGEHSAGQSPIVLSGPRPQEDVIFRRQVQPEACRGCQHSTENSRRPVPAIPKAQM